MAAGLAAAVYLAIFGGEYSIFDVNRIQEQYHEQAADLESLRADIDSMRTRTQRLENDPNAIERIARERYGMIRDGERVYRFVQTNDSSRLAREASDSSRKDPANR